jgi:hypothetical protein
MGIIRKCSAMVLRKGKTAIEAACEIIKQGALCLLLPQSFHWKLYGALFPFTGPRNFGYH